MSLYLYNVEYTRVFRINCKKKAVIIFYFKKLF